MPSSMRVDRLLTLGAAVCLSLFQLYTALFGSRAGLLQPAIHLTFIIIVAYALTDGDSLRTSLGKLLMLACGLLSMGYLLWNHTEIINRMVYVDSVTTPQFVMGVLLTLVVLDLSRRVLGWALPIIVLLFILYSLYGNYVPQPFYHRGNTARELIEQLYLSFDGIFGSALVIAATVVFIFVLFGAFLEKSGAGAAFMELVKSIAGHRRGGPALMAVGSSALMGTISGSAVANVVTTGTFTIPLMKRAGYAPRFAGAVEAVASTGGQIMPPVMGAGAFIMADTIGVPYFAIVVAATIPALLYFLAVAFQVYFEARRLNLRALPRSELLSFGAALKQSWYVLIPLIVIVYTMLAGYTATRAGLMGIAATVIVVLVHNRRYPLKDILEAFVHAGRSAVIVSSACAAAGIVVGVVQLTGVGLKAASIMISLSGGFLFPALVIAAVVSIVLGMGLPTTASYIIQAAIAAPALVKLGLDPVTAHLFVFYFACIAVITPPVAVASYAAAPIAEENASKVGWTALRLGCAAYIVPFMFAYGPELLMQGDWSHIVASLATAIIGVCSLACGLVGWLRVPMGIVLRLMALAAALLMILPGFWNSSVGLLGFAFILATQTIRLHRAKTALQEHS